MNPVLLTHTDLDGVGCAVLVAGHEPERRIGLVENGQIDARVREELGASRDVLVTDHGIEPETAELVDAFVAGGGRFRLLDHHRSSSHLGGRPWATIDEGRSATGLLFDHVGRPERFAEFARLVEDHDLWRHEDERSAALSALLGLLGHRRFQERFSRDPEVRFREGESLLLEHDAAQRREYLERKLAQAHVVELGGTRWAVCYAEQYQSDLAEHLMNGLGVAATAIVNPGKRTVSLRGRDVDVSPLARRFGGGGHARAAAFSFAGSPLEVPLAEFERALDAALGQG